MDGTRGNGGGDGAAPEARRRYSVPGLYGRGLLMGAADVVPGVSGGTLALILGIYTSFIDALGSLNLRWLRPLLLAAVAKRGERRARWREVRLHVLTIHWRFLISLGAGIVTAIGLGSMVIPRLLETHRSETLAVFFGLILASVPLPARMVPRWGGAEGVACAAACAFAFWVTGLPALQLTHALWMVYLSGVIGICAMVLPGVSGSFILLVLGQYAYIIGSIPERRFHVLAIFSLGTLTGLLTFTRVLRHLLHKHAAPTLAALTGFMAGALRAVWPFQEPHGAAQHGKQLFRAVWPAAFDARFFTILGLALAGLALVVVLERLGSPASTDHAD
jgi:putative membrane protein